MPCYNESQRLRLNLFREQRPQECQILFADDGSTDATPALLQKFCAENAEHFRFFRSEKNLGKAQIIQQAYQWARRQEGFGEFSWIGFWDADLATPLKEVTHFLTYRREFAPKAEALFGSRINRFGARVERSPLRHYLSRIFVTFVDWWLGIRAYDSQCGAKLFQPAAAELAFADTFVSRWVFDLEIILRLRGNEIVEVPVQEWRDVAGSKVRVVRDLWRLMRDLWQLRGQLQK